MTVNKSSTVYYSIQQLQINKKYKFSAYVGGFNCDLLLDQDVLSKGIFITCHRCSNNIFILERIEHRQVFFELHVFCINCLGKKSLGPIFQKYFKIASKTFDKSVIV
jgi:hypothetical protein